MSGKSEETVVQVDDSLRIAIPDEIAKQLNIEKGDSVELWVSNDSLLMAKKDFVYDAIWAFEEDILDERKSLSKEIESHTSQSVGGLPLHKYKGKLTIEKEKIVLKGENTDTKEPVSFSFSRDEIKKIFT